MSTVDKEVISTIGKATTRQIGNSGRPLKETPLTKGWTKNRKIAGAKYLRKQENMTYKQIGQWLGLSDDTAKRYADVYELGEEKLEKFTQEFVGVMRVMQLDGLGKVTKRINELVPKERKISEVVKAGEFYSGRKGSNIQVNIANIIQKEQKEYNFDD